MPDARRYDTLLAKGEDRKQRILSVAQRLLTRNGWRNTTLAQIAGEAGVFTDAAGHKWDTHDDPPVAGRPPDTWITFQT